MRTKSGKKWLVLPVAGLLIAVLVLTACGGEAKKTITEAGSTTVQPLAEKLSNAFMASNPNVEITIQGGGSSVGVKSVDNGTVDIGAISRELKPGEPALVKHLLVRDGIAIIANPSNTVNGLTKEQVRNIFAGNIVNWSEVGGPDEDIHIIAREEGSGTRTAFEDIVMGKEGPYVGKSAILQPSNGAIMTGVGSDAQSIGFVSFGYLDSSVKALAIDGVEGTVANAKNGSYPVVRSLYFLTKAQPEGVVKEFIDYCLGTEGQRIVTEEGYISAD